MSPEQALITAFIKRNKRERYLEMVANPTLRPKFLRLLPHFNDFDPKYRLRFASNKLFPGILLRELQRRHSPSIVHAISEDPALDQKDVVLSDALDQIVGSGMGTILCCLPGRLAFVETEQERYLLERSEPLERIEYVRFVVARKDEQSHVEQGIFQAASEAVAQQVVHGSDAVALLDLRTWFSEHLERPTSFGRDAQRLGICWFKPEATEHIARIWQMIHILERNGIFVRMIKTAAPGYITYEDDWQLVAEPFRRGTIPR